MNNGYIKLHRKFRDWYGYKSASRKSLWIELLLRATHKEFDTIFNGNSITLKPGQLVAGRKILAEYCGLSESWIEKLLSELEKVGQIRQQKTNTSRLISIVKWDEYQNSNNGEDNREDNKKTTKRQQKDTIQECKNEKNDKKIVYMEFVLLTQEEHDKLKIKLNSQLDSYIQRLNNYIGSKGVKYKSHYHTILSWAAKDNTPIEKKVGTWNLI